MWWLLLLQKRSRREGSNDWPAICTHLSTKASCFTRFLSPPFAPARWCRISETDRRDALCSCCCLRTTSTSELSEHWVRRLQTMPVTVVSC